MSSERFSRKGDVLTYEATVEDPVMFTKPWVIEPRHFRINNNPEDQMLESVCFDGDSGHISEAGSRTSRNQQGISLARPETKSAHFPLPWQWLAFTGGALILVL